VGGLYDVGLRKRLSARAASQLLIDEGDHHFTRRSSSACANNADALRKQDLVRALYLEVFTLQSLQLVALAGCPMGSILSQKEPSDHPGTLQR
jgi:hypothetical protein